MDTNPTSQQLNFEGKSEFVPPRINVYTFLDAVQRKKPELLDPKRHRDLMIEFAHFVGLNPDEWGMSLPEIRWLLERSPDIERACRSFRSNAV